MGPLLYMWPIVDQKVLMRHIPVLYVIHTNDTHEQVYCQVTAPVITITVLLHILASICSHLQEATTFENIHKHVHCVCLQMQWLPEDGYQLQPKHV